MIPIARLRELLTYDPSSGALIYRQTKRRARKGMRAGCSFNGYRFITIKGIRYREHRVIWAIVHGVWPPEQIDHRNGNGSDNRLENLRLATPSQNQRNRKLHKNSQTGVKGVHFRKERNAYIPLIRFNGKLINLGYFKNIHEAERAYVRASKRLFGEYSFASSRGS